MTIYEFSTLYVTFPNETEAKKLAKKLVEEQLANFVNIMPAMLTLYRESKGKDVELDAEVMVIGKIRTKEASKIIDFVTVEHPYDAPEIFTVPITHMSDLLKDNLKVNLKHSE